MNLDYFSGLEAEIWKSNSKSTKIKIKRENITDYLKNNFVHKVKYNKKN